MTFQTEGFYLREQAKPIIGIDTDGNVLPYGTNASPQYISIADKSLDSFGRLRISSPISRFDAQLTYDLQPLLFEQLTNGANATITHDGVNRHADMAFAASPAGSYAYMQSYRWTYYLPGNAHLIFVTFNFVEHSANVTKFAGYGDRTTNGIHFISDGVNNAWRILSDTDAGDETVLQANWNVDTLDGTGDSGITLDITKTQIAVIDLQALYVGRVRVGFDIDGLIIWCHEFNHANRIAYPYIQTATLPVICGMYANSTATTTMQFECTTVRSEGADLAAEGFGFTTPQLTATAGNNTRVHLVSVRPKTTFKGITNRINFIPESIEIQVTGNTAVYWELCVGQAITNPTWNDINTTYSGFEYGTGTISGAPTIVAASGFCNATAQSKGAISKDIANRYPITLNAAGVVRALGTLSLIVTGLGATSVTWASINFREVR